MFSRRERQEDGSRKPEMRQNAHESGCHARHTIKFCRPLPSAVLLRKVSNVDIVIVAVVCFIITNIGRGISDVGIITVDNFLKATCCFSHLVSAEDQAFL